MKLKKSVLILCAVLFLLALAACGSAPDGVVISTHNNELVNNEGVYFIEEWDTVSLTDKDRKKFPELAAALDNWTETTDAEMQDAADRCAASVDEDTPFLPYELTSSCDTLLIDKNVVSFIKITTSYMGGAHPNTSIIGYAFSVKDGKQLTLTDVISDKDHEEQCRQATIYALENHEYKDGFYDNWHEAAEKYLADLSMVDWTIYADGISVWIPVYTVAPHAVGNIEIPLSFAEFSEMIKAEYR